MLIALNMAVLAALLLLLIAEERRYRGFARRIAETRAELRIIAHQLRTPLTTIRKYTGLLQERHGGPLSMAQLESVSKVEGATSDAAVVLNRLLAASRIEDGDFSTEDVRTVDVRDSVEAAINAVSGLVAERGHRLTFARGPAPALMSAVPLVLHGIFDEILQNAAAYTPQGGTIAVAIRPKGRTVEVSVQDSGIGLNPEDRKHLFEAFYRGERARTMHPGNGLGMSFAQRFAKYAGGKVRVAPSRKGTLVVVELPLVRVAEKSKK
jgi:signal transduction histidine kinase